MPVTMTWYDDEQTIVLYTLKGRWTLQDINQATTEFSQTVDYIPPCFIIDMREAAALPAGILAAGSDMSARYDDRLNVIVGASRLVRLLLTALQRAGLFSSLVMVDSLQDAETCIDAHRRQAGIRRN